MPLTDGFDETHVAGLKFVDERGHEAEANGGFADVLSRGGDVDGFSHEEGGGGRGGEEEEKKGGGGGFEGCLEIE